MRRLFMFLLCSAFISLSACTSSLMVDRAESGSSPDDSFAYLAGKFVNSYRESFARIAIELDCTGESGAVYIELEKPSNSQEINLFPVQPGECALVHLIRAGGAVGIGERIPLSETLEISPFQAVAGTIYYLGQYDGRTTNEILTVYPIVATSGTVNLSFAKQSIDVFGAELAQVYPEFSRLEIEDVSPTALIHE